MQIFGLPDGKVVVEVVLEGRIMDVVALVAKLVSDDNKIDEVALESIVTDDTVLEGDVTEESTLIGDMPCIDELVPDSGTTDEMVLDDDSIDNVVLDNGSTDEGTTDAVEMNDGSTDEGTTGEMVLDDSTRVLDRDEMVCDGSITADVVPDGDVEDEVVVSTQLDEVISSEDSVTMRELFCRLSVRLLAFLFLVLRPLNLISLENAGLTFKGYHHMITAQALFILTSRAE